MEEVKKKKKRTEIKLLEMKNIMPEKKSILDWD